MQPVEDWNAHSLHFVVRISEQLRLLPVTSSQSPDPTLPPQAPPQDLSARKLCRFGPSVLLLFKATIRSQAGKHRHNAHVPSFSCQSCECLPTAQHIDMSVGLSGTSDASRFAELVRLSEVQVVVGRPAGPTKRYNKQTLPFVAFPRFRLIMLQHPKQGTSSHKTGTQNCTVQVCTSSENDHYDHSTPFRILRLSTMS